MKFQFSYPIGLRLVKPSQRIDFRNEPWKTSLLNAIKRYNSSNSTYNPKRIDKEPLRIGKNDFVLVLRSSMELSIPGRALRFFSQCIAQDPAFDFDMPNGRVFNTFPAASVPEQEEDVVLPDSISDKVFLQFLIAFFLDPADRNSSLARKKRKAVTEMKALGLSSGIIAFDVPDLKER